VVTGVEAPRHYQKLVPLRAGAGDVAKVGAPPPPPQQRRAASPLQRPAPRDARSVVAAPFASPTAAGGAPTTAERGVAGVIAALAQRANALEETLQSGRKEKARRADQELERQAQLAEEERSWELLKQELAAVAQEERHLKVALRQMQEGTSPAEGGAAAQAVRTATDLAEVAKANTVLREELRGLRADMVPEEEELARLRSDVLMQRELMERLERELAAADVETTAIEYQLPRPH